MLSATSLWLGYLLRKPPHNLIHQICLSRSDRCNFQKDNRLSHYLTLKFVLEMSLDILPTFTTQLRYIYMWSQLINIHYWPICMADLHKSTPLCICPIEHKRLETSFHISRWEKWVFSFIILEQLMQLCRYIFNTSNSGKRSTPFSLIPLPHPSTVLIEGISQ